MRPKARLDLVEKSVRTQTWTEAVVADLCKQTGKDRATIYRDRVVVLRKLAEEEAAGMEERRAAFLLDLRKVREEARESKQFSPAARLLAMESQVLGLDRVPLPDVADEPGPVDTSLEAVLSEVRRMRRASQAGHSYTAAADLLEREAALVESIRARDQAEADRAKAHLDDDAVAKAVVDRIANLPDAVKDKIKAALGGP